MKFIQKKPKPEIQTTNSHTKLKAGLITTIILVILLVISGYWLFTQINNWFETHYFQFNRVIVLDLNQPFYIEEREPEIREIVLTYPDEIDTPLKEYICEKFGTYDCKPALAVATAESGMREDAVNVNTNGTIDIGVFQINQVHWKREGCSPKELFDAKQNVDCAYQIWQEQGWTPWVAWQTGSFKSHL